MSAFDITLHLTLGEIITSVIMFGIVHGTYRGLQWCLKALESEAGKLITQHVKNGHQGHFKHCSEVACVTSLQTVADYSQPAAD